MADLLTTRAEVSVVRPEAEEVAAPTRDEAEKTAKDEFAAGFFQGYSDLKRRVAIDHPEWDLFASLGVDSDYWEAGGLGRGRGRSNRG